MLADWGCGIDMALRTYGERNEDDEREVCEWMAAYATRGKQRSAIPRSPEVPVGNLREVL